MSDTQKSTMKAYQRGYFEGFDDGKGAGRIEFANELTRTLFVMQVKFPTVNTLEMIRIIGDLKKTK